MKQAPAISAVDLLDAVPLRSQTVRGEKRPDGGWLLRIPLRRRWYTRPPLAWLLPISRERAIRLDRLGSEVWQACDGRRTVEEIVDLFAAAHDLTFHEARLSVMEFLRRLTLRGLVVVAGRPKAGLPRPRSGETGAAR